MATFESLAGLQPFSVPLGAYTKLSPSQLDSAARYGTNRTYTSTTNLYRQGERGADLYVVLSGTVQTHWTDAITGEEYFIALEPAEFSGELNLLNQRETLIAAPRFGREQRSSNSKRKTPRIPDSRTRN